MRPERRPRQGSTWAHGPPLPGLRGGPWAGSVCLWPGPRAALGHVARRGQGPSRRSPPGLGHSGPCAFAPPTPRTSRGCPRGSSACGSRTGAPLLGPVPAVPTPHPDVAWQPHTGTPGAPLGTAHRTPRARLWSPRALPSPAAALGSASAVAVQVRLPLSARPWLLGEAWGAERPELRPRGLLCGRPRSGVGGHWASVGTWPSRDQAARAVGHRAPREGGEAGTRGWSCRGRAGPGPAPSVPGRVDTGPTLGASAFSACAQAPPQTRRRWLWPKPRAGCGGRFGRQGLPQPPSVVGAGPRAAPGRPHAVAAPAARTDDDGADPRGCVCLGRSSVRVVCR